MRGALCSLVGLTACGFSVAPATSSGDDVTIDASIDGDAGLDAPGTVARSCTLSLGSDHTCVRRHSDNSVWCWGEGYYGELGLGASSTFSLTAMQVPLGAKATTFATRSYHGCAGLSDGTARCWGMNDGGQIGDGISGNRLSPASVVGLANVVEVGVGRSFSCARRADGEVTCWGANTSGQLGDNSTTPKTTSTTTVQGLTAQPLGIFVGSSHACALLPGGTGMCWGSNVYRQLGDGTTMDRSAAIAMPLGNLVQIAPSGYSVSGFVGGATCVLRGDKTVWCWGSNDFGQLGTGATSTTPTSTPAQATGLTDAVELVAGRYHACARRANGAVACWGRNDLGQVGDGTFDVRAAPVQVSLPRPAIHLGAGGFHTCALLDDDSLYCWGYDATGQLGDGTQSTSASPVASQNLCQ